MLPMVLDALRCRAASADFCSARECANVEMHGGQVAHDPGGFRCAEAGDSARVDQPGSAGFYVGLLAYFWHMAVAAADQVVVAGAGHAVAVMRIVGDEDAAVSERNRGIAAVVVQQAF